MCKITENNCHSQLLVYFVSSQNMYPISRDISILTWWLLVMSKVFLEISQNSLENTCARVSFLIKLQDTSGSCFFLSNRRANKLPSRFWSFAKYCISVSGVNMKWLNDENRICMRWNSQSVWFLLDIRFDLSF